MLLWCSMPLTEPRPLVPFALLCVVEPWMRAECPTAVVTVLMTLRCSCSLLGPLCQDTLPHAHVRPAGLSKCQIA